MRKSDMTVTVEELKRQVRDFCQERGWDPYHSPKDLAIGLVTESSELLEIFRFVSEEKCMQMLEDPGQREKMSDELADSLYFILRFAQMYGFDLSRSLADKTLKNAVKYPAPKTQK